VEGFRGLVRLANSFCVTFSGVFITSTSSALSQSISSIYLSYQGGGDYRGIYDIGFKRGFMGYIGLLLNDPYKIDRMGVCMWISFFTVLLYLFCCFVFGYMNQVYLKRWGI
jgi:hypothetical protein